jgi:F420H(2)-dependent quinone reductase
MDKPTSVIDSPSEWVKKQIDEYVATDGAAPVFRYGAPLLLLTYQGAKSGTWRRTCLIGMAFSEDYLLVASKGGAPENPAWYDGLVAHPQAWLQVGAKEFPVTARTATPAEKAPLWDAMVGVYPDYADYQQKTTRDIPVVVLS